MALIFRSIRLFLVRFLTNLLPVIQSLKSFPTFAIIDVINISCNPNLAEVFMQKYFNINLST